MAHLLLPGTSASMTVPLAAAHQVTDGGAWEFRVRMRPTSLDGNVRYLIRTAAVTGTDGWAFFWDGAGNRWVLHAYAAGTTTIQDAGNLGDLSDTDVWVRYTFDGASSNLYFKSTDATDDPDAVDFGAAVHTVNFATPFSVGTLDPWRIGAANGVGGNQFVGRVYRLALYDGVAGTRVFDAHPSDPATWLTATTFAEKANDAVVTVQGDAVLVGGNSERSMLLGM